jgi:hypothetical protein
VTLETPNAEPAQQQRLVNVVDPSVERINPSADPIGMRELAERSGGRSFRLDAADSYAEHLHRREIASIASQEATWAWNRLPILLMLCTWIGCEWILRRKAGLP